MPRRSPALESPTGEAEALPPQKRRRSQHAEQSPAPETVQGFEVQDEKRRPEAEPSVAENAEERHARHSVLVEVASINVLFVQRAIERGKITNERAWEHLQSLQGHAIDLESAIEEFWTNPPTAQFDQLRGDTGKMAEVLAEVRQMTRDVQRALERQAAGPGEASYWISLAEAKRQAEGDVSRAKNLVRELEHGSMTDGQREAARDLMLRRADQIARVLTTLSLSQAEKDIASYEAMAHALAETRSAAHALGDLSLGIVTDAELFTDDDEDIESLPEDEEPATVLAQQPAVTNEESGTSSHRNAVAQPEAKQEPVAVLIQQETETVDEDKTPPLGIPVVQETTQTRTENASPLWERARTSIREARIAIGNGTLNEEEKQAVLEDLTEQDDALAMEVDAITAQRKAKIGNKKVVELMERRKQINETRQMIKNAKHELGRMSPWDAQPVPLVTHRQADIDTMRMPVVELRKQKNPVPQQWEQVLVAVKGARAFMRKGLLDDAERAAVLDDLSIQHDQLVQNLQQLQQEAKKDHQHMLQKADIAHAIHLIEDVRHEIQNVEMAHAETAPLALTRRIDRNQEIATWEKERRSRITQIEKQQEELAKAIRKSYKLAKDEGPEDLIARGSLKRPLLGSRWDKMKTGLANLVGSTPDALTTWRTLDREREKIIQEIEPTLTHREDVADVAAKTSLHAFAGDESRISGERQRQSEQEAAANYRRVANLPNVPDDAETHFFGGTLEHPTEDHVRSDLETLGQDLAYAEEQGVTNPDELYRNIANHPAAELLSFTPAEYVRQRALVAEARRAQGQLKSLRRFFAKSRLSGDKELLDQMQDELREVGIDPTDGRSYQAPEKKQRKRRE